jgi:hypothetical protein
MDQAKSKLSIIFTLSILAVLISVLVLAQPPGKERVAAESKGGAVVTIPSHAIEVAPGMFSLGQGVDVDGSIVEGYVIYHHKSGHKSGPGAGGDPGGSTCFAFLANGAKWKSVEPWVVNPENGEGLSDSFVLSNLALDIQKWEVESGADILGDGSLTASILVADTSSPDNVNEVYFGDVDGSGAIAVTIVWGVFRGPPGQRGLVEWDQVYDDVDFNWSSAGEANKMDFENIAVHELGHAVGMGHPGDDCTEESMFRFASEGETKKRDLNAGDIAGIQDLY